MKFSFFLMLWMVLYFFGAGMLIYSHEEAHVKSCQYLGGVVTDFSILPWNAHTSCELPKDVELNNAVANAKIEEVGYPANVLYFTFMAGLYFAMIPLFKEED